MVQLYQKQLFKIQEIDSTLSNIKNLKGVLELPAN